MPSNDPQPPYFTGMPEQLPPQRQNTTKIIFLIVGGVLLTMLVACGGFLALGYWAARGVQSTVEDSQQVYVDELKEQLGADMAKLEAEVGEIQRLSYDLMRSVDETTEQVDVDVYEVAGTTGSGEVIVRERVTGEETATRIITLYLDDGRELLLSEKEVERPADAVVVEEEEGGGAAEAAASAEADADAAAPEEAAPADGA